MSDVVDDIRSAAREAGFDLVGIAPAVSPLGFDRLREWVDNGFAGEMHYVERRLDAYRDPANVLDGVRSVILLGMNYHTAEASDDEAQSAVGRVARYARGGTDYHDLLRERMCPVSEVLHLVYPECRTRGVVDTAPILEREFARLAGLGWFGKNTMLINKRVGSWLLLCAILTDIELPTDSPHETAHCGTCTRCLEACPTDAFPEPYVLDATKCISYLTIELRGQPVPEELREGMGDWLFGCDICQDVCPWNRKAPISDQSAFQPRGDLAALDAEELLSLSEAEFKTRFRKTPLERARREGLLHSATIVLGNTGDRRYLDVLTAVLDDVSPAIREGAAWAIQQINSRQELPG